MPTETKPPRSYGCMDRNCMFGTPPGQHTNAGCRCNHPRTPEDRARLRENVIAALEQARRDGEVQGWNDRAIRDARAIAEGQFVLVSENELEGRLESAREEGRAEIRAAIRRDKRRDLDLQNRDWDDDLPSPPPKDEPDHLAAGGEGLEPNEEGDR